MSAASAFAGTAAGPAASSPSPRPSVPVAGERGWFHLASTRLSGLPAAFWIFELYLFVGITLLDVEWPSIGRFRPRLVLGTLALASGLSRWFERRPRSAVSHVPSEHRFVAGWLAAFLLAGFVCAAWAFDTSRAWRFQIEHATTMLGFFLFLALVRTRREVLVTVLVFTAASGFYLLRSALEYMNGKHQFTMGVSRMMGAGDVDPNSFGGTIAFSLPLVLWAAIHARSRLLVLCVLGYGLLASYCAVQTHSRSGFILLAMNVLWALVAIPSGKARLAIAAVLVAFGAYLVGFQSKNALERYASIFSSNTYEHESSTRGRIEGYQVAATMFKDEPLHGVGPDCWSAYRMARVDGQKLMPHNMPGQLIATMGALGTLTFAGYLVCAVSFALAVRRRRRGSPDPWDRAVRSLAATVLVTTLLLLVSGTAAHNVDRSAWYLMPALLACAARAPDDEAAPAAPPTRSAS